jgi:outer membrane receptor protein involved in Fe transport
MGSDGHNTFLNLDFSTEPGGGHEITAGARLVRNDTRRSYADFLDGRPDFSAAVFGSANTSRLDSTRLFVQDEWRIDRSLALNLGLSVEQRRHRSRPGKGEHGLLGRRHDAVQGDTLRLRQFAEFAHQAHLQLRRSLLRFGAEAFSKRFGGALEYGQRGCGGVSATPDPFFARARFDRAQVFALPSVLP